MTSIATELKEDNSFNSTSFKSDPQKLYELAKNFWSEGSQATAIQLFRVSAERGNIEAQCTLGQSLLQVPGNEKEALFWLRKAAGQNHKQAQHILGFYLFEHSDNKIQSREAVELIKRSR